MSVFVRVAILRARDRLEQGVDAVDLSAPHSAYARAPISCLTAYAAAWETNIFRTGMRERLCTSEVLFVFGYKEEEEHGGSRSRLPSAFVASGGRVYSRIPLETRPAQTAQQTCLSTRACQGVKLSTAL